MLVLSKPHSALGGLFEQQMLLSVNPSLVEIAAARLLISARTDKSYLAYCVAL